MDRLFAALGEPRRRAILELLADGERSAGEIVVALQAQTPTSQPTVSQHLKVLREAGLVSMRADGTRRLFAIEPTGVVAVQAWLGALVDPLSAFTQPLDALATEVARGRRGGVGRRPQQPSSRPSETA